MGIIVADAQGSIDKSVSRIIAADVQGAIDKEVQKGLVAPSQGLINKKFYENWVLHTGTILSASASGSTSGYGSSKIAYSSTLTQAIKPTKAYLHASATCGAEVPYDVYVVAEYYNGSSWISIGSFTLHSLGEPKSFAYPLTVSGNISITRMRYRATNTTSYESVTVSISVDGKITEWYAKG